VRWRVTTPTPSIRAGRSRYLAQRIPSPELARFHKALDQELQDKLASRAHVASGHNVQGRPDSA
jgi:hypothetical protein